MKKFLVTFLALLMVLSTGMFVACKNDSEETIIKRLENNSYEVQIDNEEWIEEWLYDYGLVFDIKYIEKFISAEHEEDNKIVHVVFCKDRKSAKEFKSEVKENAKIICWQWDWTDEEFECERVGNVIYFGHEDAVEIAK